MSLLSDFIQSPSYAHVIKAFYTDQDGLDSAQLATYNFRYRHDMYRSLGAWRWLGVYENRDLISDLVFDSKRRGLDFGGARGTIGHGADVCDLIPMDAYARKTKYKTLRSIPAGIYDYIWSSHTLEHIDNIDATLAEMLTKLKPGGVLVLHLPSWTCRRWQAGRTQEHKHTFCLAVDANRAAGCESLTAIDTLAAKYFDIKQSNYCGDNSIFLVLGV